jgi:DNA-binding transcriptional regulator YiaG
VLYGLIIYINVYAVNTFIDISQKRKVGVADRVSSPLQAIGERLREVRGAKTKAEFAAALGLHVNSLSNYEKGERAIDATVILSLVEVYNVNPSWLITGENDAGADGSKQALLKVVEIVRPWLN